MTPGDVVLVRFPFSDVGATKKRPAVLLVEVARSARDRLATVAMITSQVESPALGGDVLLRDWEGAGLLYPSRMRLAKIATIDGDLVERAIGRLARRDLAAARAAFRQLFSSWV